MVNFRTGVSLHYWVFNLNCFFIIQHIVAYIKILWILKICIFIAKASHSLFSGLQYISTCIWFKPVTLPFQAPSSTSWALGKQIHERPLDVWVCNVWVEKIETEVKDSKKERLNRGRDLTDLWFIFLTGFSSLSSSWCCYMWLSFIKSPLLFTPPVHSLHNRSCVVSFCLCKLSVIGEMWGRGGGASDCHTWKGLTCSVL